MISNAKKAVIHIAANQLGLSKDEYKKELIEGAGVESSLDLNNKSFAKAMDHFKSLGYIPAPSLNFRIIDNLSEGDKKVMLKINAIRLDLRKPWGWVDGIAKQQTGIEKVQWLKNEALFKVLQAMVIHQKRQAKRKS
ncbi:MAG: DUF1018 domain-containing protein [Desulfobacteraceae bacterium]|nr:DUF1018 domain-containing protein [Desulfobacteraceae bacterium]